MHHQLSLSFFLAKQCIITINLAATRIRVSIPFCQKSHDQQKSPQHKSISIQSSSPKSLTKIKSSSLQQRTRDSKCAKGAPSLRLYDLLSYYYDKIIQIEFGTLSAKAYTRIPPTPTTNSRKAQKKLAASQLLQLTRSEDLQRAGLLQREGLRIRFGPQSVGLPPPLRSAVPDLKGQKRKQGRRRRRAAQL